MRAMMAVGMIALVLVSGCGKDDDDAGEDEASEAGAPAATTPTMSAAPTPGADTVTVKEEKPGLLAKAAVTPQDARAKALAAVPGGTITSAEIEEEDGKLIYSFDIRVAGQADITEVHVDAKTGEVAPIEHEKAADEAKEKQNEAARKK